MKPIVFTATSARQWTKLSPDVRSRIDKRLTELATTGHGDVKRLKGRDGMRLRVGDWRVIFYEDQGAIVVAAVGHRREIYDREDVMSVRFQKTPRGEVAILPRKDYELLVAKASEADEDAGTARIVARARKEIADGAPLLPKDVVDRIANGENPVRVLREWRDITQMYLSFKTNLSQGHISDIENGRRTGTVAALRLIANVLKVPLDMLVEES
jgi:mRNA-degrading endonuclease RelE of RelBE toxin-antitoxin system